MTGALDVAMLFDERRDLIDEMLRRRIDAPDQRLELRAILRMDVELHLLRLCDEIGVLHGRGKGGPHHLGDGGRHVGRRDERTADALAGVEEFERLLVLGVLDQVEQERRVLDLGVGLGAGLEQNVDNPLVEPVRVLGVGAVVALAEFRRPRRGRSPGLRRTTTGSLR